MSKKISKKISTALALALCSTAIFAGSAFAAGDTQAPTTPQNFRVTRTACNAIEVQWDASTDNVGIKEYRIINNVTQEVFYTKNLKYAFCGLQAVTNYSFCIYAVDTSNNTSSWNSTPITQTLPDTQGNVTYQLSGSIAPNFTYAPANAAQVLSGYELTISNAFESYTTYTDENGAFMFPMLGLAFEPQDKYTLTIKKDGMLQRTITAIPIQNHSSINQDSVTVPIELWGGDVTGDNAVNMADNSLMGTCFNTVIGNPNYIAKCDLNKDGAINMTDVNILAANFNKTSTQYSNNVVVAYTSLKKQY